MGGKELIFEPKISLRDPQLLSELQIENLLSISLLKKSNLKSYWSIFRGRDSVEKLIFNGSITSIFSLSDTDSIPLIFCKSSACSGVSSRENIPNSS